MPRKKKTGGWDNKFSPDYIAYMKSPEWEQKRLEALAYYGDKCMYCGAKNHLQVHHKTYDRLGHERMSDLMILCRNCHMEKVHHRKLRRVLKFGFIPVKPRK